MTNLRKWIPQPIRTLAKRLLAKPRHSAPPAVPTPTFDEPLEWLQAIPLECTRAEALLNLPRATGPTFVADSTAIIRDEASLAHLFHAVFATMELQGEALRTYEHVKALPALWNDRHQLIDAARSHLIERLSDPTANEADVLAALESLRRHRETTKVSMKAYRTKGKPVPDAVFWPNPTDPLRSGSIFEYLPLVARYPFLDARTPIGSAGSCFAMEIAYRLQRAGFNYVITEPDLWQGLSNSCAKWGAIFNTPSFRQLVEKAFGYRTLPRILWTRGEGAERVYLDPFREDIVFNSVAEYESTYDAHVAAARDAFMQCKAFVFTLGMNEVWRLKSDGTVFSRAPWGVMPDLVERQILTVDDNVRELQSMTAIVRRHNPDLRIIVSVSPVPLHATFRGDDTHVIAANCHSKSTLRVAAEEFVARTPGAYYFPSYETVMYCSRNPWQADERHVSSEAVDRVMQLFEKMFVKDGVSFVSPKVEAKAA